MLVTTSLRYYVISTVSSAHVISQDRFVSINSATVVLYMVDGVNEFSHMSRGFSRNGMKLQLLKEHETVALAFKLPDFHAISFVTYFTDVF